MPRLSVPSRLAAGRSPLQLRSQSTQTPTDKDKVKEALKHNDDIQRDWDARLLTYEQMKPKTQSPTPDAYIIDVREPDEVIQGSIPSAVNLPLSVLGNSLHLPAAAFQEKHGFTKPKRDQEIIFYCRSGKRSASACDIAKRNGYTNLYNYEGSWLDWIEREGKKAT
ncbi:hypothetical protein CCMSSC00406_0000287 [Pleurotus cornucopiae]|uniref:Uncharacterized protein n=1 Tax=Pleurotus cornucopiae TaxID=5321 RepID=A0ACB7IZ49_PLECO|nr:hypothetical protein CCMSSC00406_0000287 [Pleurotus cornucopiae]